MAAAKRELGQPPKSGIPIPPIFCKIDKIDANCFTVRFFYTAKCTVGTECQPNMIIKLPFRITVGGVEQDLDKSLQEVLKGALAPGVTICSKVPIGGKIWKVRPGDRGARSPWGGVCVDQSGVFSE